MCDRCKVLLYLPGAGGNQHIDIEEGRVRRLRGDDRDRLYSKVVRTVGSDVPAIPDHEVNEEELAEIRGFSPAVASAIEAPDINLVMEEPNSHPARPARALEEPLFLAGSVVAFEAEKHISGEENQRPGHAAWRGKELLGIVMGVPNVSAPRERRISSC
jgi:hypothetical protein